MHHPRQPPMPEVPKMIDLGRGAGAVDVGLVMLCFTTDILKRSYGLVLK